MRIGRYQLEAAIQSAHVEGARTGSVSWAAVVTLYDALAQLTDSPVAFINRALAVAELEGPDAGLAAGRNCGGGPTRGIVSAILGCARQLTGPALDRLTLRDPRIKLRLASRATRLSANTSSGAARIFRSRVDDSRANAVIPIC